MVVIIDDDIYLKLDKFNKKLKFTLGAGIELEEKYNTLEEMLSNLNKISVCIDIILACANNEIKKINREFNKSYDILDFDDIETSINISNFDEINEIKLAVIKLILKNSDNSNSVSNRNKNKKKLN